MEFSLALNNRTGKFFALRDMIKGQASDIRRIRYWRFVFKDPPTGLKARILGRLMTMEVVARGRGGLIPRWFSLMRPKVPVLFTDPFQSLLYRLSPMDIVVIHDMGPISAPMFYAPSLGALYKLAFKGIIEAKPRLIFVSEASRDAFTNLYGSALSDATVIYNPIRIETSAGAECSPPGVREPFLLTVGAVGARKNQAGVLRGFRVARLYERGYQMVICGGPEPGHAEVVTEAAATPGAQLIGYATDVELRWLYRHAAGFVLPSWLEGFGVPAAEAIQRGLLPVLSDDPALMEVAGPSAIYVEPGSDVSIASGMLALVEMDESERRSRLVKASNGLRRFEPNLIDGAWSAYFDSLAR